MRAGSGGRSALKDCICSEISENLRINIREKTEVRRGSRSPSPEVTHTIRIAMKYHGQSERKMDASSSTSDVATSDSRADDEKNAGDAVRGGGNKNSNVREDGCCNGVNVALDFTLNCSSVQLTARDVNLRTTAAPPRRGSTEIRNN